MKLDYLGLAPPYQISVWYLLLLCTASPKGGLMVAAGSVFLTSRCSSLVRALRSWISRESRVCCRKQKGRKGSMTQRLLIQQKDIHLEGVDY
jgi:hypothetical protein